MNPHRIEAGCDEAGRGCLAGPVVAAAVILPPGIKIPKLNDSKQIPESMRDELRGIIMDQAIAWGIGICSPEEIDRMNILRASFEAMHRAIRQMEIRPEHLLIDGNRFVPFEDLEHTCVVKGDGKFMSIAAASILAKTERDCIMKAAHEQWPVYAWNRNMGYPTRAHRDAIREHGSCSLHRKSFRLLPKQLKLDL